MKHKKPSRKELRQRAEQQRWWDAHVASLPKSKRRKAQAAARKACQ